MRDRTAGSLLNSCGMTGVSAISSAATSAAAHSDRRTLVWPMRSASRGLSAPNSPATRECSGTASASSINAVNMNHCVTTWFAASVGASRCAAMIVDTFHTVYIATDRKAMCDPITSSGR